MKFINKAFLLSIIFLAQAFPQNYKLVWSDEFNDTTLDLSKWSYEIGNNNGWGNSESEYYTNRPQNCFIQNGILNIVANKENYNGYNYTSARIKTQGNFSFAYGKIEARIKLPYGNGIWPAFWLLGDNITSVGWPACGESDIMEMIGGSGTGNTGSNLSDSKVYGTLHWKNSNGTHASYGTSYVLNSGKFADNFHNFGMIWTPQKIQIYVDGTIYYSIDITPSGLSAFQKKFFIILNLAVGGNWPGYPNSSTVFPQTMQVDYVRVYQDTTGTTNTEDGDRNAPQGFLLQQNYPNPFNPSTTINYSLPKKSLVSINVFDVLGNKIKTLIHSEKPAGKYSVSFNADNIPSGIYFYSFHAGDFEQIRKMVLLR